MRQSHIHPRHDQVSELTRGQNLPLAPVHDEHLRYIAAIINRAWNGLLVDKRDALLSGSEAELNSLMEIRLNALLETDELWSLMARNVARGKETMSFDGSHLEKRPDLSIYLTDRSPSFPLVVECKLVHLETGKTVNLYCDNGLSRFVRGEYAWAAREGFMLAYVRDESTIAACLRPLLLNSRTKPVDAYLTCTLPEPVSTQDLNMARSSHNREFKYLDLPHGPGAIGIWHVWVTA